MYGRGDVLEGDVILSTHVCPDAPTRPHDPVPFMDSPVSVLDCNREEIDEAMDAVVSIDTTKGNRLLNHRGIALSPTVKEGWILRVSDGLLGVLETVTGEAAHVLPITTQDITPYGNGVHHINSIMQPCVATPAPVVGLALTAQSAVMRLCHGCQPRGGHRRGGSLRDRDREGIRTGCHPLPRPGGVRPPGGPLRPDDPPPVHRRSHRGLNRT